MSMRYYKRRLAEQEKLTKGGSQVVATPTTEPSVESVDNEIEVEPKKKGRPSKK